MSLFRTNARKRELVFDIESEFLANNIERFLCNLTHKYSFEAGIYIFLSYICRNMFFMVLKYIERCIDRSCVGGTFFLVPFSSNNFYRSFRMWEILLSNGFIVTKSRKGKWEKFTPFFCRRHVCKNLWKKLFVVFLSILLIEYTIRFIAKRDASKTVFTTKTIHAVHTLWTVTRTNTKMCPISPFTRCRLVAKFTFLRTIVIHRVYK